jgi:hypothetical protein
MDLNFLPDMGRMGGCSNRKNALFAGSDEGAENWSMLASLNAPSPPVQGASQAPLR